MNVMQRVVPPFLSKDLSLSLSLGCTHHRKQSKRGEDCHTVMHKRSITKSTMKNIKHDHYKSYRRSRQEKKRKRRRKRQRTEHTTLPLHRSQPHPQRYLCRSFTRRQLSATKRLPHYIKQKKSVSRLRNPKMTPFAKTQAQSPLKSRQQKSENQTISLAQMYEQASVEEERKKKEKKKSPAILLEGSLVT